MATHHRFGPVQRRHQLLATLHRSPGPPRHRSAVEPRRHQTLDPMLSASNGWLPLAPVAKPRAAPAHNMTSMQSKDSSAPTAGSADELEKDDVGPHANAGEADLG
jgi:hypothetical protein